MTKKQFARSFRPYWKPRATAARCARTGGWRLEAFRNDTFDLVLSDIVMPEMDGLKLLAELRNEDPDVPVIMVTAMHDISIALEAIRAGAYDYILKPFEKDQLHLSVRRALEHRRLVMENRTYQSDLELLVAERTQQLSIALQDLEQSYDYTLEALGGALDAKDAETEGHCQRVTAFTITIARSMGVDKALLRHIARGAFLHDIGKMGVPDSILTKPGPLTAQERDDHAPALRYRFLGAGTNSVPEGSRGNRAVASGVLRRFRISARAEGRADSPGGENFRGGRYVGRNDLRPAVPESVADHHGARRDQAIFGETV